MPCVCSTFIYKDTKSQFYVGADVGESLIPIIVALNNWGEKRLKEVSLSKKFNNDL